MEQPSASLSVCIGDRNETVEWPEPERPELQRMHFYDFGCREAYIATESDFPYRPSALAVMDGLINACIKVRSRIDTKLYENARTEVRLPKVPDEVKATEAGTFLDQISGGSQVDTLDELIRAFDESAQTIDELKQAEILLRSKDSSNERKRLLRQAEKMDALLDHLRKLDSMLGEDAIGDSSGKRRKIHATEGGCRSAGEIIRVGALTRRRDVSLENTLGVCTAFLGGTSLSWPVISRFGRQEPMCLVSADASFRRTRKTR